MRFTVPIALRLADSGAEEVRRNTQRCITEIQERPIVSAEIVSDIELADGIATPIPHGLGRAPIFVAFSAPRGATTTGRIVEGDGTDRRRAITVTATGHGATITVAMLVA